jgi:hypothetical protein
VWLSAGLAAPNTDDTDNAPQLYTALAATLDPSTHRAVPRIERATIDPTGDATVVFAIQDQADDPVATRADAIADALTVLRTAHASPDAGRISSLTVLGTFPFQGAKSQSVRETPVPRAAFRADHANAIDLDTLRPADLPHVLDEWWVQGAFATVGGPDTSEAAHRASGPRGDRLGARVPVTDEDFAGTLGAAPPG